VHFDVDVEGSGVGERVVPACFITIVGQLLENTVFMG